VSRTGQADSSVGPHLAFHALPRERVKEGQPTSKRRNALNQMTTALDRRKDHPSRYGCALQLAYHAQVLRPAVSPGRLATMEVGA
jgi:hypothetical protein